MSWVLTYFSVVFPPSWRLVWTVARWLLLRPVGLATDSRNDVRFAQNLLKQRLSLQLHRTLKQISLHWPRRFRTKWFRRSMTLTWTSSVTRLIWTWGLSGCDNSYLCSSLGHTRMIVNFDHRRSDVIAQLKHSKDHRKDTISIYILEYFLIELNVMIFHWLGWGSGSATVKGNCQSCVLLKAMAVKGRSLRYWPNRIGRNWFVWATCLLSVLGRTAGFLTPMWVKNQELSGRLECLWRSRSALRLRRQISSYLDVPGLCAERATAKETSSTKACAAALCELRLFRRRGQAFVAQLVQLIRPETPLPQTEAVASLEKAANWVARPDVLVAVADIYASKANRDKIPEVEQALARDNFHLFAGVQGATMLDTATSTRTVYTSYNYTHIYAHAGFFPISPPTSKRYY